MRSGPKPRPEIERFLDKVDFGSAAAGSSCLEWMGTRDHGGYGRFRQADGKFCGAHRKAIEFVIGPIPSGMYVLHSCDNPGCVRPEHLRLGTNQDNVDDRIIRGHGLVGERNHKARLTASTVLKVRLLRASGRMPNISLAARLLGIGCNTLFKAIDGKTWRHVPMPEPGKEAK